MWDLILIAKLERSVATSTVRILVLLEMQVLVAEGVLLLELYTYPSATPVFHTL